jgi:hypothetical protein
MLKFISFFLLISLCLTIHSVEQEWATININPAALKSEDSMTYNFSYRKRDDKDFTSIGTLSLYTKVTSDEVLMKDKYQVKYRGEDKVIEVIHHCKMDKFLSPIKIELNGKADEASSFVASIKNGKAKTVLSNGKEFIKDIPDGTITTYALMRLLTLVSRKAGSVYKFKYQLESEEMHLKKDYCLKVMSEESISVSGKELFCTKFKLTGGSIRPVYYWVSQDGVLQKLLMDDRKQLELIQN